MMDFSNALKLSQPIPFQNLRCSTHQSSPITQACSDFYCKQKPFMCSRCQTDDSSIHNLHQGRVVDLETFVQSFSSEMAQLSDKNKRLYTEFLTNNENVELLQILEQGDEYLKKIEDQIDKQKVEVAQDITILQEKVQEIIQQIKTESLKKLDNFHQQYSQAFKSLKENIDSFFQLSRKNFYYSNTNTFQQKLVSLPNIEAQELIIKLKHHMNITKSLNHGNNSTPLQILTDLQTLASFLHKMDKKLPTYERIINQGTENNLMDSIVKEIGQVLNNVLENRLQVPVGGQKEASSVLNGANNLQLQVDSRNVDEFYLKPFKKYQLDFPIQIILSITDTICVLTSSSDLNLRVFDTSQKKITNYQGHTEQINYMEKILIQGKQKQFATSSLDKQLIIWMFEDITNSNQIVIYRKFQFLNTPTHILDLKDFTNLAVCDSNKEISVCNTLYQKVGSNQQTRHLSRINGLVLLRQGEKFISFSSDSIINIWRIVKRENQEPIINIEQTLHDPLYGTITQIFVTTQWNNQAIIINAEGEIKIFDLTKNCPIFSQFGKKKMKSSFLECIFIEQADRKLSSTNWLIAFSFNESIAFQFRLTNDPCTIYQADVRLEHKLFNDCTTTPLHKIQLFSIGQPQMQATVANAKMGSIMLMFANQNDQELMVYEVKGK